MRTLYICYLSLREPLVQSQVLPYLRQLVLAGVDVHLLTFEKELAQTSREELARQEAALAAEGITWFHLRYHKRPSLLATIYDIVAGGVYAIQLAKRHHITVLHARAHIAMAMALIAGSLTKCAAIFDMRGLVAEEYVDAGIWKEGSVPFRAVKWIERAALRRADQIIVLTNRARNWLIESQHVPNERISVIPCCVDVSRFAAAAEGRAGTEEGFELVYAGSVVGLYMLEEMARFFLHLKQHQPRATFKVLTLAPAEFVSDVFRRVGIAPSDFQVAPASPADVPGELLRARMGISFRRPTFSQIAASPTKIAEYLAAGIPVVSNVGTGDTDEVLDGAGVGVTVSAFDSDSLEDAAIRALALANDPQTASRCRQAASKYFDLVNVGGTRYRAAYERLSRDTRFAADSKIAG